MAELLISEGSWEGLVVPATVIWAVLNSPVRISGGGARGATDIPLEAAAEGEGALEEAESSSEFGSEFSSAEGRGEAKGGGGAGMPELRKEMEEASGTGAGAAEGGQGETGRGEKVIALSDSVEVRLRWGEMKVASAIFCGVKDSVELERGRICVLKVTKCSVKNGRY
jgi:hypothetical protein